MLCTLRNDVVAERQWVADQIARRWGEGVTAAVLVRRNADAGPMAQELVARGIPVDVVGLAGLLSIPEVAQIVSTLRLVADPADGVAAMAVLTGPRWRLGTADLAALWRRAVALDGGRPRAATAQEIALAAADPDSASLADALADPGSADNYSAMGYRRITALEAELTRLRGHLNLTLTDLVAEIRRVIGVEVEVRAAGGEPRIWTASPMWWPATRRGEPTGPVLESVSLPAPTACSTISMPPPSRRTVWRRLTSVSLRTACRSSPCMPPRAWSGRSWPSRT